MCSCKNAWEKVSKNRENPLFCHFLKDQNRAFDSTCFETFFLVFKKNPHAIYHEQRSLKNTKKCSKKVALNYSRIFWLFFMGVAFFFPYMRWREKNSNQSKKVCPVTSDFWRDNVPRKSRRDRKSFPHCWEAFSNVCAF